MAVTSHTALQKIERGLEARSRENVFARAADLIVSPQSLEFIRSQHDAAVARHQKLVGDVEKVLADFDAQAKTRYEEFRAKTRARIGDNGKVVQERRSNAELAEFRAELKAERRQVQDNALNTVRPTLDEVNAEIARTTDAVRRSMPLLSPLAIADAFDFGSEKMTRLIAQCERMQPQALRNLALRAVAPVDSETGPDRHLIAAIALVNSSRESSDQNFSTAQLVEASPFAAMSKVAMDHAKAIELSGRHATNARDRLVLGRGDESIDHLESGLVALESESQEE